MIIEFIPLTQISLVTDHQVDESARSAHLFSAGEHLKPTLFTLSC